MRAAETAMGGDAVELRERAGHEVSGHSSRAEDFKSAAGKGDAPGRARLHAGKSWRALV